MTPKQVLCKCFDSNVRIEMLCFFFVTCIALSLKCVHVIISSENLMKINFSYLTLCILDIGKEVRWQIVKSPQV